MLPLCPQPCGLGGHGVRVGVPSAPACRTATCKPVERRQEDPRHAQLGGLPILQIAARNAFWSLAVQPTLAQLAAHAECNLQECTSDLERVFTLLMSVLKCKEEEALATCRLRTYFPQRERHEDELMSADAALEMRTKDNQQAVLKQKR